MNDFIANVKCIRFSLKYISKLSIILLGGNYHESNAKNCDLITANPEVIINNPVAEAAAIYQVSPSSIVRLSKKIGYKGYTEFRYALEAYKNEEKQSQSSNYLYSKVIDAYVKTLEEMKSCIDDYQMKQFIDILKNKNIISVGLGNSSLPAQQLIYCMYMRNRIGKCIDDTVKLLFLEESMDNSYVVVIFSVSGNSTYYENEILKWKKDDVSTVLITTNPDSSTINVVDIAFVLPTLPIPKSSYEDNPKYLDNRSIFYAFIDIVMAYYCN